MAKNVFVKKKQIVIDLKGDIPVLGVSGPIDIPYWETLDKISQMLMYNVPIREVLSNGDTVKLDLVNFDQENDPNNTGLRAQYESTYKPTPTQLDESTTVSFSDVAKEASGRVTPPVKTKAEKLVDTEYEDKVHSRVPSKSATIREASEEEMNVSKNKKKLEKASKLYVPPKVEDIEEK